MKIRRIPAMLPLCIALASGSESFALGLGNAALESELGRPLLAKIPVIRAEGLDSAQLLVNVLPVWDQLSDSAIGGLDPRTINIASELDEDGNGFIYLRSNTAIVEPFLNFILSVRWPMGHISREYTLLLELPNALEAVPRSEQNERSTSGNISRHQQPVAPMPASAPRTVPTPPKPSKIPPGSDVYTTRRGDSLWKIAAMLRRSRGGSQNTLMEQLFALNPHAFIRGDRAMLKERVTLDISPEALASTSGRAAASPPPPVKSPPPEPKLNDKSPAPTPASAVPSPAEAPYTPTNSSERATELSQALLDVSNQVTEVTANIEAMTQRLNALQQRLQQLQSQYETEQAVAAQAAPQISLTTDTSGETENLTTEPSAEDASSFVEQAPLDTTLPNSDASRVPATEFNGALAKIANVTPEPDETPAREEPSRMTALESVTAIWMKNSWILLGVVVASTAVALIVRRRRNTSQEAPGDIALAARRFPQADFDTDESFDSLFQDDDDLPSAEPLGPVRSVPRSRPTGDSVGDFADIDVANKGSALDNEPPAAAQDAGPSSIPDDFLSSITTDKDGDAAEVLNRLAERLAAAADNNLGSASSDSAENTPERESAAEDLDDEALIDKNLTEAFSQEDFKLDDSAFDDLDFTGDDLGAISEPTAQSDTNEDDDPIKRARNMSPADWLGFSSSVEKKASPADSAAAFIELNDYEGARNVLEQAIEKDEDDTALCMQLLDVYAHLGETEAFEALAFQLEFRGEDADTLAEVDIMRVAMRNEGDRDSLSS